MKKLRKRPFRGRGLAPTPFWKRKTCVLLKWYLVLHDGEDSKGATLKDWFIFVISMGVLMIFMVGSILWVGGFMEKVSLERREIKTEQTPGPL